MLIAAAICVKQWLAWIVAAIDGSYDERPLQPLFIEAWTSVGL